MKIGTVIWVAVAFVVSLGVLGQTDQARAIWTEAQSVFAADPAAMAQLLTAAQSAGVAE